ncbi:MAG: transposase family protein, partial [Myxococcales bacterium]|nr:transposase family protein [Myxococcales bacterium]
YSAAQAAAIKQAVKYAYGAFGESVARGLKLRHDHGSQFTSRHYQAVLKFLGIESSPSLVANPEGNGISERFVRTIKEQLLWRVTSRTPKTCGRRCRTSVSGTTRPGSWDDMGMRRRQRFGSSSSRTPQACPREASGSERLRGAARRGATHGALSPPCPSLSASVAPQGASAKADDESDGLGGRPPCSEQEEGGAGGWRPRAP